jgi:hypothetical protein
MRWWTRLLAANTLSVLMAGQAWALSSSAHFSVSVHLNPARDPGCISQLLNEPTQATVTVVCPGGNVPVIRPQPPVTMPPPPGAVLPVPGDPITPQTPDVVAPAPPQPSVPGTPAPDRVGPVMPRSFEMVNDRLAYWRIPGNAGLGLTSFASPFVGTGTVTSLRILTVNSGVDGERLEMLVSF